ncbi:N-acetyltransferase family protein [Acidithiobacillus sp.]|uniref:GNAT family N-acetyltransferase n=1 Tax=Acidithiobacillus sp. TaxID=1872118 RepID=UPI0032AF883C
MSQHRLRLAVAEDLAQIVAIYNSTIASGVVTADTESVSVASRRAWLEGHDAARRPVWVMEEEERICAWMSFSDFYGRPAYRHTVELAIYVREDQRGRGLGSALLQHAMESAPHFAVTTLLAFVFAENRASLRLFEKFGFSRWGHLPAVAEIHDESRDLLILGRKMPA